MNRQRQNYLSQRSHYKKLHYKSCCIHWYKLPTTLVFPALKENFVWISLENGQVIKQPIKKEAIDSEIQNQKNTFPSSQCNIFINRYTLVIYCITCKKEIFDIYTKFSSQQDLIFLSNQRLNPFRIRSHFLKPINEQKMFFSNLEYPKSFQKQKKNCAIFISPYQNTFLESVLRLLAFTPTFSLIAQDIDMQKIKSPAFRQLIKLIKIMNYGQYRILKISEFQDTFFSEYPEFLSYENHNPMKVLFTIFKLIESELGWRDSYCHHKQILQDQRLEWDISRKQYKYSPLKEMLLSKSSIVEVCSKCKNQKERISGTNFFQCLSIEAKGQGNSVSFIKRKSTELNIIKAIENSFRNQGSNQPLTFFCDQCSQNTEHQVMNQIQPGNYLFFNIESSDNFKLSIPKDLDLNQLNKENFIVSQDGAVFQFIAGIFKETEDKATYAEQYGTVVYHIQNKKYICFSQRNITYYESLNFQKTFSVLIYKRKPNQNIFPIKKNIRSTFYLMDEGELQVQNPIPLPDFYQIYLSEHYNIPPLVNPFICHHGLRNVGIEEMAKCSKIKYLPIEIYNFLVQQFGGRKIKDNVQKSFGEECQTCLKGLQHLQQIKTIEKQSTKYADNFSIKKGQVLIYKQWLQNWKSYLYQKPKQNYNLWGNPPPLEINNYLGMKQNNPKQIDHSKYSKISIEVWMTLVAFHLGGPQVTSKKTTKNNNVRNYINLRLQEATKLYEELGKCLSPKTRLLLHIDVKKMSSGLSVKQEQQSEMVSSRSGSGSEDEGDDRMSLRSASTSREKSMSKIAVSSRQKSINKTKK